eukprot:CAMPEP_0196582854 /NCGR_PEP_ID=MMETSP1081-20130531/40981_1 /TAXON_ID=36882 /ORGANISM="Pyramimonas amylifera, Strain CCMP720" /LENGTH=193 /DNA_ID=CAMNT_0041903561 /DNA_START=194 /DNA_END=778 /DNA_ORIENTATION=+
MQPHQHSTVPLMTPAQVQQFKAQLKDYTNICYRLVLMHNQLVAEESRSVPLKLATRWIPTAEQVQVMEEAFAAGHVAPSKAKLKDLSMQLMQLGPVGEANLYNWFQNRKARAKKRIQSNFPLISPTPGTPNAELLVTINNKLWKVPGGMLDVYTTFGENCVLRDTYGNVVPVNEKGVVLSPVVHASVYITTPR